MKLFKIINEKQYKCRDISLYLTSEQAEDLIDDIYSEDNDEYIENFEHYEEVLDGNDIVILSRLRNSKAWFVEPISYTGNKQLLNETDACIIQSEILEEVDLNQIEYNELILIVGLEDKEEIEEGIDMLDDVINDILDALAEMEDDECPHCKIKSILEELIEAVREETLDDVIDKISEFYSNN